MYSNIKRKSLAALAALFFAVILAAVVCFVSPFGVGAYADGETTVVEAADANGLITAINSVEEGGTVRLTADVTFDFAADESTQNYYLKLESDTVTHTIDLNGYALELNTKAQHCFYFTGAYTDGDGNAAVKQYTVTITNGTIKGSSISFLSENVSGANLVLKDVDVEYSSTSVSGNPMTFVTGKDSVTELQNVTLNANAGGIEVAGGSAVIADSEFNVAPPEGRTGFGYTAVAVSMGGTVTVESGCYGALYGAYVYSSGGTMNINGGEFTGSVDAVIANLDTTTYPSGEAVISISDGTFNGEVSITSAAEVNISGGVYTANVSDYLAEGATCAETSAGYIIYDNQTTGAAYAAGKLHATLADAIAAAADGGTVVLVNDCESANGITIEKNLTLELNGHNFTVTGSTDNKAIAVSGKYAVVVNGAGVSGNSAVTLAYTGTSSAIAVHLSNGADLTLKNVVINVKSNSVAVVGVYAAAGTAELPNYLDAESVTVNAITTALAYAYGVYVAASGNLSYVPISLDNCTLNVEGYAARGISYAGLEKIERGEYFFTADGCAVNLTVTGQTSKTYGIYFQGSGVNKNSDSTADWTRKALIKDTQIVSNSTVSPYAGIYFKYTTVNMNNVTVKAEDGAKNFAYAVYNDMSNLSADTVDLTGDYFGLYIYAGYGTMNGASLTSNVTLNGENTLTALVDGSYNDVGSSAVYAYSYSKVIMTLNGTANLSSAGNGVNLDTNQGSLNLTVNGDVTIDSTNPDALKYGGITDNGSNSSTITFSEGSSITVNNFYNGLDFNCTNTSTINMAGDVDVNGAINFGLRVTGKVTTNVRGTLDVESSGYGLRIETNSPTVTFGDDAQVTVSGAKYAVYAYYGANATLNMGYYDGAICSYSDGVSISGGTYTSATASNYLADGYVLLANTDDNGVTVFGVALSDDADVTEATAVTENGTYYFTDSLKEILENEADNASVKLLTNFNVSDNITVTKNLTLDLNGHNVISTVAKGTAAVQVEGLGASLTINDDNNAGGWASNSFVVYCLDGGSVTVNGGVLTASDGYAVLTSNNTTGAGDFEINGGVIVAGSKDNIYGNAIYMPSPYYLTITGGEIYGSILVRLGTVNISGGTIYATVDNTDSIEDYYAFSGNAWYGSALTVYAGTYSSDVEGGNGLNVSITGGNFVNNYSGTSTEFANVITVYVAGKVEQEVNINITEKTEDSAGATFTLGENNTVGSKVAFTNVAALLSLDETDEYAAKTVVPVYNDYSAVLSSGSNYIYYSDLAAAVAAAGDGDAVYLLKDISIASQIDVRKSVTIDLNGHTVTATGSYSKGLITVYANADVTVKNGSISSEGLVLYVNIGGKLTLENTSVTKTNAKWSTVQVSGEFTLDKDSSLSGTAGGTIGVWDEGVVNVYGKVESSGGFAVATNGSASEGKATINIYDGATIESDAIAVYVPSGTANISGGTITGATAVYIKSGTVTISGGTFAANGEAADFEHSGNGAYSTGDAIVVENCDYPNGEPVVKITGGAFTSANAEAVGGYAYSGDGTEREPVTGFIEGGSFSSAPAESYISEASLIYTDENGNVSVASEEVLVEEGSVVARVGAVGYATLQDAINNAEDGSEIVLLSDIGLTSAAVIAEKNLTLDLNGKSVTRGEGNAQSYLIDVASGAALTVKDGIGGGTIYSANFTATDSEGNTKTYAGYGILTNGDLTVAGGSISGYYGVYASTGSLTVSGGSISGTNRGVNAYQSQVSVSGGSITGTNYGIVISESQVTVSGGNITGQYGLRILNSEQSVSVSGGKILATVGGVMQFGGTVNISGDAQIESTGSYAVYVQSELSDATLNITGGTISADTADSGMGVWVIGYKSENSATVNVSGGTVSGKMDGIRISANTDPLGEDETVETKTEKKAVVTVSGNAVVKNTGEYGVDGYAKVGSAISLFGKGAYLYVTGGTVAGTDYGIVGNGTQSTIEHDGGTYIEISGGTVTSNDTVIYHPQIGSLVITGGSLTGTTGIEIRSGSLNISGGTITATGNPADAEANGNGTTVYGAAVGVSQHTTNNDLSVTISGGTFNAESDAYALWELDTVTGSVTDNISVSVTGGTFNSEVASQNVTGFIVAGTFATELDESYIADGSLLYSDGENYTVAEEEELVGEGKAVAKIGATAYGTLAAAIEKAQNGDTVTLLADVTESVTVSANQEITLDLNGKTITNKAGLHTITNLGVLTVTDGSDDCGGTVDNVTHGKGAVVNYGYAYIYGGSFTRSLEAGSSSSNNGGNSWYVIKNYGYMVIGEDADSSVTVTSTSKYSSLVANGYQSESDYTNSLAYINVNAGDEATIVINGGKFDGGINTLKNDDYSTATINGGEFINTSQYVVLNWNSIEINGGTFTASNSAYATVMTRSSTTSYIDGTSANSGEAAITGGTFNGSVSKYDSSSSLEISGGNFSVAPSYKYLAEGYSTVAKTAEDGSTYYGVDEGELYVRIDNVYYETINDAVAAISTSGTIVLMSNIEENVTVPAGKTVTFDLGGFTLSAQTGHVITVEGILKISNGSVISDYAKGYAIYAKSGSEVQITGKLSVDRSVDVNCLIYVYGAKLTVSGSGNVFGQTLQSQYSSGVKYPIYQENGEVVLGGSAEYYGLSYVVYTHRGSSDVSSITVTGGTFHELSGKDLFNIPDYGKLTLSITGGTYKRIISETYMPDNYVCYGSTDEESNISYIVAAYSETLEKIVAGRTQTEFAWVQLGEGYAYTAKNGIYTVVSATEFVEWAKSVIENEYNLLTTKNNYSQRAIALLAEYAQTGYDAIDAAATGTPEGNVAAERAMYSAVSDMQSVLTLNSELASEKTNAVVEFKVYAAAYGYSASNELVSKQIEYINGATLIDEVEGSEEYTVASALASAKAAIDEEVAAAEVAAALAEAKANAVTETKMYALEQGVAYLESYETEINGATDIDAVATAVTTIKTVIDTAKAEADKAAAEEAAAQALAEAKANAVTETKMYALEQGVAYLESYEAEINDATDIDAVATAVTTVKTAIDTAKAAADKAAAEEAAAQALAEAKANAVTETKMYALEQGVAYLESYEAEINGATDIDAVATAVTTIKTAIDTAKAAADKAAAEEAAAQALAEAIAAAKNEVKLYTATNGVTYTAEMDACFNDATAETLDTAKNSAIALADAAIKAAADAAAEEAAAQVLAEAKTNAITETKMYALEQGVAYLESYEETINGTTDIDAVATAVATVKTAIDTAKAAADKAAAEEAAAQALAAAVAEAKNEVKLYAAANGVAYTAEMEACFDNVTAETVDSAKSTAIALADAAVEAAETAAAEAARIELDNAKAAAKSEIGAYAEANGVEADTTLTAAIDAATDKTGVAVALIEAKTAVDRAVAEAEKLAAQALAAAIAGAKAEVKAYAAEKGVGYTYEMEACFENATAETVESAKSAAIALADAAKAAADEAAAVIEAKELADSVSAAETELKILAAYKGVDYDALNVGAFFADIADADALAAAKSNAEAAIREAAAQIPDSSVDATDKQNAVEDIDNWLDEYLDLIIGELAGESEIKSSAAVLTTAKTAAELREKLIKVYSEENADKIVGYYNDAVAAIESADTTTDIQIATLTFRSNVMAVEKLSDGAYDVTVYIWLALVLVIIVIVLVIMLAVIKTSVNSGKAAKGDNVKR